MPLRISRIQSDLQGVASGGLATQQINLDGDVYGIALDFRAAGGGGLTAAQIVADVNTIQVMRDGNEIFNMTARDLIAYNDYYLAGRGGLGATPTVFTAGQIYIPFDKPTYPIAALQEAFGIGAMDTKTLQVNVTFNAVVLTTARVGISTNQNTTVSRTEQYLSITNVQQSSSAAGIYTINNLPLDVDRGYLAFHTSTLIAANVTQAAVFASGQEVRRHNRLPVIDLQKRIGRVPQLPITQVNTQDFFTIDLNDSNDDSNFLRAQGLSSLRIELNFAAAPNSFPFYIECVRGLAPIA